MENRKREYVDILPSRKWYGGCKNRNDEMCRDLEVEGIYKWLEVDEAKVSEEYRGMVNGYRKRMGWEEYDI